MSTGIITFTENNSGGSWWLKNEDYAALEAAGWIVHWMHDPNETHEGFEGGGKDDPHVWAKEEAKKYPTLARQHSHKYGSAKLIPATYGGEPYLGNARATSASKEVTSLREGVEEWQRITGQNPAAEGCNCCGTPFHFEFELGDKHETLDSYIQYTEPTVQW